MDEADPAAAAQRRRRELGAFLRARRAALQPQAAGIPQRRRRHVPGLRREEVAALAEVGVSWYTLLEQGRIERVSAKLLRGVTRALQLSALETRHVLELLRDIDAPAAAPADALLEFVRDFALGAAFVSDDKNLVVAWNRPAAALFAFETYAADERDMLALMVRSPRTRAVFADVSGTLRRMIGVFRAADAARTFDAATERRVAALRRESEEFDALWREYAVQAPTAHICTLRDDTGREVPMQFLALTPVDHPGYTIVVLRPAQPAPADDA